MAKKMFTNKMLKYGKWLFSQEASFLRGVVAMEGLPDFDREEIAFAGRSNVGKSSLVNALCNRKLLAKTSGTPGRTRELNFFEIADHLTFVDLPGYGYAKASKTDIHKWSRLTELYLKGRPQLRRIFLLVDSRHGLKESDKKLMKDLDICGVNYQIILTKADKIKEKEREEIVKKTNDVLTKFVAAFPRTILTSAEKKLGIDELRAEIGLIINYQEDSDD
jgi:GTP-binding protein